MSSPAETIAERAAQRIMTDLIARGFIHDLTDRQSMSIREYMEYLIMAEVEASERRGRGLAEPTDAPL